MSLSSVTFAGILRDLLESLARMGARRVYLLNGHGGNDELIRLIAREEAPLENVAIGAASYWTLAWEGLLAIEAHTRLGALPGHAGHFETALMLALRPELVHHEEIPVPGSEEIGGSVWPEGFHGTVTLPGSSPGVSGTSDDAARGTAAWGERLLEVIVRDVTAAIDAFHRRAGC
jgi:creatinine amidohydrolase